MRWAAICIGFVFVICFGKSMNVNKDGNVEAVSVILPVFN